MRIALVIGQAAAPGRFVTACHALAAEIRAAGALVDVIDLAAQPVQICDGRELVQYDGATRSAVAAIEAAGAVVLASPVYRASFSGVLKNLLDILPLQALSNKAVAIVAMGATDHHYLGVDGHLRAVLAWFGALVLPTSVYLTSRDFEAGQPGAGAREELRGLAAALIAIASRTAGATMGPTPLAARR
jgi:FMN reductase